MHRIREERLVSKEQVGVLNGKIDAVRTLLFNLDLDYTSRSTYQPDVAEGLITHELVEDRYPDTIGPFDVAADKETPGAQDFFGKNRLFFYADGEDVVTFSIDFDDNFALTIEERERAKKLSC